MTILKIIDRSCCEQFPFELFFTIAKQLEYRKGFSIIHILAYGLRGLKVCLYSCLSSLPSTIDRFHQITGCREDAIDPWTVLSPSTLQTQTHTLLTGGLIDSIVCTLGPVKYTDHPYGFLWPPTYEKIYRWRNDRWCSAAGIKSEAPVIAHVTWRISGDPGDKGGSFSAAPNKTVWPSELTLGLNVHTVTDCVAAAVQ